MKKNVSANVRVQKFGNFLSAQVMPNIGAFIAWGILTALFIDTGWLPNKYLQALVGPTLTYLMPVLIGYTGGYNVHGRRGGVIGAVATMGVVIGADITMLIGGMIMGPLAAWLLKQVDKLFEGKVKPGMEMLIDNFSLGILGAILMLIGFVAIEPIFTAILTFLSAGVNFLINRKLLPLVAILVQPAKVLFLNNAVNHGIMIPLGVEQAAITGKSVLFMVEANDGCMFGVTLAFALFGKGTAKRSAPAAGLISFVGGIGEVVFPYILSKPITILGPIFGSMTSLLILTLFDGGTVAAISPGSFFALIAMSAKGSVIVNIISYLAGALVSMLIVGFFLKRDKSPQEEAPDPGAVFAAQDAATGATFHVSAPASSTDKRNIEKIAFACDAGMGSSVMAVSIMKTKMKKAMLDIDIDHTAVAEIPEEIDMVITTRPLEARVRDVISKYNKDIVVFAVDNLMDNGAYDVVIQYLKDNQ